jgi:trehalose 6-phosphate synthase
MINAEDLIKYAKKTLKNKKFVVAIQREPYLHMRTPEGIKLEKVAGGAHILLDGILKQVGGLMVAIGSGNGDAETADEKGRILVPPKDKSYTLKRVFLKKKDLDGFYYGFANQTLWPMCHAVFIKPRFNPAWWESYIKVNQLFANAILDELGGQDAFVWINDYHLALLPQMLKEKNSKLTIGTFWHIPWPTYEIFRICPWRKNLLEGLAGSDFIGFHRGYHVENFVECCRRELQVIVDTEPRSILYKEHQTKLANIPAGIDYHEIKEKLEKHTNVTKNIFKKDFDIDSKYVAIGVDRIDYTKGIPERLKIIDRFLELYPEFIGNFTYLSIGAPSRLHIPEYKNHNREILDLIEKINWKYSTSTWQPIVFIDKILPREKIFAYYKVADSCLVTSLDDGMNLVAKEYVICSDNTKGMLVLSKFTGAAKDLKSAVLINPYDTEDSAILLKQALTMPKEERYKRNKQMEDTIKENNIYDWAIKFIGRTIEPS